MRDDDPGLLVLRAMTERAFPTTERQAGGAILRFPGRIVPTPRPSLTAAWAVPPKAVPSEQRLVALEQAAEPLGAIDVVPDTGLRPVLTAGAVLGAALTVLCLLVAAFLPTSTTLGVAGVLAMLTALLWSARMRATAASPGSPTARS